MKHLLIAFAVLLPFACHGAEPTPLRVVSWNVEILIAPDTRPGTLQKYRFDYARNEHLDRTADVIEVLNPDIFTLVEATSKDVVDQLIERLHKKGMTEYTGYHIESHDTFTGMDVALITKYPPDEVDGKMIRTYYSPKDDPTYRHMFQAEGYDGTMRNINGDILRNSGFFITVKGHKLGFLGLHLKSNPSSDYANALRGAQAKIAARIINGDIVSRGYTPIVLGDLNDYDPDIVDRDDSRDTVTDVIRRIKDFDKDHDGDELFNVAEFMPNQEDRYSSHWDWNENGARDPQDVLTMIDHILLPVEFRPYVKRAFIAHCVPLSVSDHFPVVVDLELPAKE